ncbi:serine/arginine repetitive matrix protein 3 [Triticum aestivum]|uniref:serine/arginine repetitive matrix protein 3 n=1 Tax=Triticum aestivum TaxID=4565 RepID=UPI001D028768|nr:serine/arginine repetitive matrix protein 3-like [Triticum aestivum]
MGPLTGSTAQSTGPLGHNGFGQQAEAKPTRVRDNADAEPPACAWAGRSCPGHGEQRGRHGKGGRAKRGSREATAEGEQRQGRKREEGRAAASSLSVDPISPDPLAPCLFPPRAATHRGKRSRSRLTNFHARLAVPPGRAAPQLLPPSSHRHLDLRARSWAALTGARVRSPEPPVHRLVTGGPRLVGHRSKPANTTGSFYATPVPSSAGRPAPMSSGGARARAFLPKAMASTVDAPSPSRPPSTHHRYIGAQEPDATDDESYYIGGPYYYVQAANDDRK